MCYLFSSDMFQSPFLFPLFFYIFLIPLLFAICLLCVFPQYLLYFYFGGYVLFCFYSRGEFLHAFREKPWNIFPSLNTHPQTDSNPLGAKLPEAPPLVLLFAIECWLFFFLLSSLYRNQCSATVTGVTVMQEMPAQQHDAQNTVLQEFISAKKGAGSHTLFPPRTE